MKLSLPIKLGIVLVLLLAVLLTAVLIYADDTTAVIVLLPLLYIGYGVMPAITSVAGSVFIADFLEKLFPSLREWKWVGRLVGLFISIILMIPLICLMESCVYHFLFLLLIVILAIASIVFLVFRAHRARQAGNSKPRYILWVFFTALIWAGLLGIIVYLLIDYGVIPFP